MSKTKTVCFGEALEALKMGKKVFRSGWNGRGMFLKMMLTGGSLASIEDKLYERLNYVGMKTADDKFVPWLCSQTDMLACDWVIMVEGEKKETPDRIPVPENIKFYRFMGQTYLLVSPNGKLILGQANGFPSAGSLDYQSFSTPASRKAFLVPCNRSDLKPGDIAFRGITGAPPDLQEFTIHHQYCVILNEDESAYWYNEMDMKVDGICGGVFWYKVIFE